MATVDLGSAFGAIVQTGSSIRNFVDTGYRVSEEFKTFELRLDRLIKEKAIWEGEIKKHGLSDDAELIHLFRNAASEVESEWAKLCGKKKAIDESCCSGCWPKLKMASFPSELEQTIVRVSSIFEDVFNDLKKQRDIPELLQQRAVLVNSSLSFRKDNRYIRLEETNGKVVVALRNADGPPVVLLHGISGSGKTSLARDVALQVEEAIHKKKSKVGIASKGSCTIGTSSSAAASEHSSSDFGSLIFEEVIFLECGNQVDPQTKQLELRNKLRGNSPALAGGEKEERSDMQTILKSLLKERSVLIILDDVWKVQSVFLQSMVDLGGRNVKWLVTSQQGDLCSDMNCESLSILIEDITVENGRRILGVHIGLPVSEITPRVEEYMDKIIQRVQVNPHAITCIAPAIDPDRFENDQEWEAATEEVSDLLSSKASTLMHSKAYGQNVWEAIQVGFDLLTKFQQSILVEMAICKGPSMAEEIIQFLCEQTKESGSVQNFSQARRELQNRQLIKIITYSNDGRNGWGKEQRRWSIHALVKDFIMRTYFSSHGDQMSWIERLSNMGIKFKFETDSGCEVVNTLCALHFDDAFGSEFAQRSICASQVKSLSVVLRESRKQVVQSISQLLVHKEKSDDKRIPTLHSSVQQVFLGYVRDGHFHEESTSDLLRSCHYAAMIDALKMYAWSDEYAFVGQKVISSLVGLLQNSTIVNSRGKEGVDFRLLSNVSNVIGLLVYHDQDDSYVKVLEASSFTKAFAQVTNLLITANRDHDSRTKEQVATAIADLAYSGSAIIQSELTNSPGLLEGLVEVFFRDDNVGPRARSLAALGNLASGNHSFKMKLMDVPGMVEGLVKALTKRDHQILSQNAGLLLGTLAQLDHAALKIVNSPGAVQGLLNGLRRDASQRFQVCCARTVANLAGWDDNIKSIMFHIQGLQDKLVDAAREGDNDGWAVCALTHLNPQRAKEMQLHSEMEYYRRGRAEQVLGLYKEALEDMDEACRLSPSNKFKFIYSIRSYVKTKLLDLEGALADANTAVQIKRTGFTLQERGVLKRMMDDLPGALMDLDESLALCNSDDYEVLKHRGLVKFLSGDEDGARADAEKAIACKHPLVDNSKYENSSLGTSSVQYLNFQLR